MTEQLKKNSSFRQLNRFLPLVSFFLGMITFIVFLAFYKVLGHGNYTILRGDLFAQYIDFISMFLRVLKGEESFWYSFSIYLGSGTVLTHAYYCLSPFNLLYLIDGISLPAMTIVIITLKFALASASFTFFAQKVFHRNDPFVLFFSLCYSMNTFSVAFHFNMVWLDALYMLPVLIWLLFELVDHERFLLMTICWAYMFITNFYMAYISGIFTFVAFVLLLWMRLKEHTDSKKRFILRKTILFSFSILLAAGLSAILLFPSAAFLFSNRAQDNDTFETLQVSILDILNSMFIGAMPEMDNKTPLFYCGLPVLILLPFYFFNKNFVRRERVSVFLLLLFFVLCTLFLPLFMFMHAFDFPNWYSFRYAYCLDFLLCAAACRYSSELRSLKGKKLMLWCGILIMFYSFMIAWSPLTSRSYDVTNSSALLAVNTLFLLLWCLLILYPQKRTLKNKHLFYWIPMGLLLILELSVNGYICMDHTGKTPFTEERFSKWYNTEKASIVKIREDQTPFFRVGSNYESNNNAPSLFGYAGFNTFSTSDDYELRSALHSLGIATVNRAIMEEGYTPVSDMLLGKKYTFTNATEDSDAPIGSIIAIQKNDYALPLAYMVNADVFRYAPTDNPFTNQEQLISLMTGKDYQFYTPVPDSELQTSQYNMILHDAGNHTFFSQKSDLIDEASFTFSTNSVSPGNFYGCFTQDNSSADSISPYLIGTHEGFAETPVMSYGCIIHGSDTEDNASSISVYMNPDTSKDTVCQNIYFVEYNNAPLAEIYGILSENSWDINQFSGDSISGTVTATQNAPVFFTTIPFDNGWNALVDGVPYQIYSTMDKAFIALVLDPGVHDITLYYIAPGSRIGAIITLCSLFIFCTVWLLHIIRSKSSGNIG